MFLSIIRHHDLHAGFQQICKQNIRRADNVLLVTDVSSVSLANGSVTAVYSDVTALEASGVS